MRHALLVLATALAAAATAAADLFVYRDPTGAVLITDQRMPATYRPLRTGVPVAMPQRRSRQTRLYQYRTPEGGILLTDQVMAAPYRLLQTHDFATSGASSGAAPREAGDLRERRLRYWPLLQRAAAESGLEAGLIDAVVRVESAYRSRAVSPKGAVGLMQLMPATAADYGLRDLTDPLQNLRVGSRHLAALLDRYGQDLELALAAYNAGVGAVSRHGGVPPFAETRAYVSQVLALLGRTTSRVADAAN